MALTEHFLSPSLPSGFYWLNKPAYFNVGNGLNIITDEQTDFWQNTHYGFQRDNGHCLFTRRHDDFSVLTQVDFYPKAQYDQCGLMVRIDKDNWLKVSTEYEHERVSWLGSVVTNLGYSDWATQAISSIQQTMWYRISKREQDFLVEYSPDGATWQQMRVAHLHVLPDFYEIGVYACSPVGKGFHCCFKTLEITDNQWLAV